MRLRLATNTALGLFIALLVGLAAWTTAREIHRYHRFPFGDFNYLQTGGECLFSGCDPYDYAALNAEAKRRHELKPPIWPMTPVYPPSSLLVLLPFEHAGWPTAAYLFDGLACLMTAIGCAGLVWSMRIRPWSIHALPLLALLLTRPMASAVEFANPALLVTGIITISCLLLLQGRGGALGWVLLGLSLALKPHLVIGALFLLLWRPLTRVSALKASMLWMGLLFAGTLAYRLRLGSFHFFSTLKWVLWLSGLPGGSSDFANDEAFDFLNLQTTISVLPHASRALSNGVTWAVTLLLAALAGLIGHMRRAARDRPWAMIAILVLISLLPTYHRGYDRMIGLLLVPAGVELSRTHRRLAAVYAVLLAFWVSNDTIMTYVVKRWHFVPQNPVEEILLCVLLLFSLWRQPGGLLEPSERLLWA